MKGGDTMDPWEKAFRRLVKHMEMQREKAREKASADKDLVNKAWFQGSSVALSIEMQVANLFLYDLGLSLDKDDEEVVE